MTDRPDFTNADDPRPALEQVHGDARSLELALTALYESHRGELFAFLVRMTHDREVAEDLLQETFIRLITEARAGRLPDLVRPWLYRVAANAAISRSRHGAVWNRLVPRLVDRREPIGPESEALRIERDSELHVALAHLAPDGRAALLLAGQGFSGREIAASIGRSEAATRTLICRARIQLRLILDTTEGQA